MTEELRALIDRSRLIGTDQSLVIYGGGNTSAKGAVVDHLGRQRQVMWVKGSGADLATAGDVDYPAMYLDDLRALGGFDALDDEQMVDLVARALVRPDSRRPSIETLLHAFLPFRHIDHVHADAICALTNHPDGREAVREALGDRFAYLDWIRPGFTLSKLIGELAEYEGVVLAHHGLVTWSDDSDTCYQRTLEAVAKADEYLTARAARQPATGEPERPEPAAEDLHGVLLKLRGSLSQRAPRILNVDDRLRKIADRPDAARMAGAGISTADHMLRIKPWSAYLEDIADPKTAVEAYSHRYSEYVERHRHLLPDGDSPHDPLPRVILVPGVGAVTTGANREEARVVADIALHTHSVAARVLDTFGDVEGLPEEEIFGVDYWPLELYKLRGRRAPARFSGRAFVITGAASGIGRTTALDLAGAGASLVLADLDSSGLAQVSEEIVTGGGPRPVVIVGDQSDEQKVVETVNAAVCRFGGLDGAVINAGIGLSADLVDLSADQWRRVLNINLNSAFLLTREALRALRDQGIGGSLVYVASKNAFGPGAGFGAYSVSKAGMVQLMRIAAMEGGRHGVRANAVNPDAVFDNSRLWSAELRAERAAAYGVATDQLQDFYAGRNLLHSQVMTADVAHSVAFLLSSESCRTTGCVLTVDGGVASAFPR